MLSNASAAVHIQGGPKSCTFSTHHIFAIVQGKVKRIAPNVPKVSANKDQVAIFMYQLNILGKLA